MTEIINLFGAPGSGKSTTRAGIFHRLKLLGYNCEEVPEFAKDLTWEERKMALACQPYIFGKQLRNMERLVGKVDIIITDSPLLLSYYYGKKYSKDKYPVEFYRSIYEISTKFGGQNYFLRRDKPYNPTGRNQTEDEAREIDKEQYNLLRDLNIPFKEFKGNESALYEIIHDMMDNFGRIVIKRTG